MKTLLIILSAVTLQPMREIPMISEAQCQDALESLDDWHALCVTTSSQRLKFLPQKFSLQSGRGWKFEQ